MSRIGLMISAVLLLIINTGGCSKKPNTHLNNLTFNTVELSNNVILASTSDTSAFTLMMSFQNPINRENDSVIQKLCKTMLLDFIPNLPDTLDTPEIAIKSALKEKARIYAGKKANELIIGQISKKYTQKHDISVHTVTFCDKNLISYTIKNDKLIDEAHPLTEIQGFVMDLNRSIKIQEEDLFDDNSLPIVHDMILKKLEAQNHVNGMDELEQIGFFDLSEMALFKNFYLNNEGITYVYNPYEIGSYALGTIEVLLTFEDLRNLINPESPLTKLFQK